MKAKTEVGYWVLREICGGWMLGESNGVRRLTRQMRYAVRFATQAEAEAEAEIMAFPMEAVWIGE